MVVGVVVGTGITFAALSVSGSGSEDEARSLGRTLLISGKNGGRRADGIRYFLHQYPTLGGNRSSMCWYRAFQTCETEGSSKSFQNRFSHVPSPCLITVCL